MKAPMRFDQFYSELQRMFDGLPEYGVIGVTVSCSVADRPTVTVQMAPSSEVPS